MSEHQNGLNAAPTGLSQSELESYGSLIGERFNIYDEDDCPDVHSLVKNLGGSIDYKQGYMGCNILSVRGKEDFTVHTGHLTFLATDRVTIGIALGHYLLHYLTPKRYQEEETKYTEYDYYGSHKALSLEALTFARGLLLPEDRFVKRYEANGSFEFFPKDKTAYLKWDYIEHRAVKLGINKEGAPHVTVTQSS
jgi:hypothetical protein